VGNTLYLVDSNILLRWVRQDDRDYPLVVSATDIILREGAELCYTSRMWQNSGTPVPVQLTVMDMD
jgi:hypothetical protein